MRRMILLAAALFTSACSVPIGHVEIIQDTVPPLEHEATAERIALTHGNTMAITVLVFDEDGDQDDVLVSAITKSSVFRADKTDEESDEGVRVVLSGSMPGTSDLIVTSNWTDGEVRVPVEVLAQE